MHRHFGKLYIFPVRYNPDKLLTCIEYCGKYLGAKKLTGNNNIQSSLPRVPIYLYNNIMIYSTPNGGTYATAVESSNDKILKYNIPTYVTRDEKKIVCGIRLKFFWPSGTKLFSHRGV